MSNPILEALGFRHACKQFNSRRKIPREQFEEILACGRLSPSSFGIEPWKFIVVKDPSLRKRLRDVCWDQAQVTEASHVMVIAAKSNILSLDSDYVQSMFTRRGFSADMLQAYLERYRQHHEEEVVPYMSDYAWAAKQCYIALANMMTAAASVDIDSCPLEGFSKTGVEDVLQLKQAGLEAVVACAFGYRAGEQTQRYRLGIDEVVEYR